MKKSETDDPIFELAKELVDLTSQVKALGLFLDDRELANCEDCDLIEDVDFDGFLFVCRSSSPDKILGLSFIEEKNGDVLCPKCRKIALSTDNEEQ